MIFDGRKFAREKEKELSLRVERLKKKPKIVSFLVGNDRASEVYTKLKARVARRVGVEFVVKRFPEDIEVSKLIGKIKTEGSDLLVCGVMVQLPLPSGLRGHEREVLESIPRHKDADGLRYPESGVIPAATRAVISILEEIEESHGWEGEFVVVGAEGVVGRALVGELRKRGVEVKEVEIDTKDAGEVIRSGSVVISCVGSPGVVRESDVKKGVVVVDVGVKMEDGKPVGDMGVGVYDKARVSVRVPGGVGPVTIVSLMENVLELGRRG